MFVGFLTSGQIGDLKKTLTWAKENGFKSISIATDPSSEFFNVKRVISKAKLTKETIESSGVIVSAIGFYGNPISKDESLRKTNKELFLDLIEAAHMLNIPVVTGWVGLYPGTVDENIGEIKKVWPDIVERAEKYDIKIAIENCPGNIAYRPDIWEAMFKAIPSKNFGLEFDPSHLICQLIDPIAVADEFGDKIYHTHMKDAQILWKKVKRNGIRSEGWSPHRLPGYGDLGWSGWAEFISILKKYGYNYALSIEHEDPYFMYEEGLILARKFLQQFTVP